MRRESESDMTAPGVEEHHYRKFSAAEYRQRHEQLRRLLRQQGLDGAIVYGGYKAMYQANARWLTNMTEGMQYYAFFPTNGEPTAWNALYPHLIAAQRMSIIPDTRWGGPSIADAVATRIEELGLAKGRLGLIGVHAARGITLPMDHYLIWQERLPNAELVNITRDLENIRLIKSEEEIAFFAQGAALTDHTMAELIKAIKPGVDEINLYGRMQTAAFEVGGEFDFALLGSTSMSDPHMPYPWHVPTTRKIEPGDVVLNEISVGFAGCSGQLIVPICVGEPDHEYQELYDIARQALTNVQKVLRPGANQDDVIEAARPISDNDLVSPAPIIHGWPNPPMRPVVPFENHGKFEAPEPFTLQENTLVMIEPNPATTDGKRGVFLGALHVVTPEGGRNLHNHTLDFVRV